MASTYSFVRGLACSRPGRRLLVLSLFTQASLPAAPAHATEPAVLPEVRVSAQPQPKTAEVAGFGRVEDWRAPLQTRVVDERELQQRNVSRLADLVFVSPGVSDSYNAPGYWDTLSVRGYTLDNRANYRRDGLPISAETALPLDNKAAIEILEGSSGVQAGISAPGGLVNLVVKRPLSDLRSLRLRTHDQGGLLAAADVSQRMGERQQWGLRANLAYESLRPHVRQLDGRRWLVAAAADWRPTPDQLAEFEFEHSRQSQPSLPGFSLLGDRLPAADEIDPRRNLNDQAWSGPVVFRADTASLRLTQRIGPSWQVVAHGAVQRLRNDDRIAFPYGCDDSGNGGPYYADRYCPDGRYDLYDFRSPAEGRRTTALKLAAQGGLELAGVQHDLNLGLLFHRYRARPGGQAYNGVGQSSVFLPVSLPADPTLYPLNTRRDERSTEWSVQDRISLGTQLQAWLGLRHTRLGRGSSLTDGSEAVRYQQQFTTPWLGLSYAVAPGLAAYASWGEGVETYVTPNRPDGSGSGYARPGQPLPAQRSRQAEVGMKGRLSGPDPTLQWQAALFTIRRPALRDEPPDYVADGQARHRGLNASLDWRAGPWEVQAGLQWLHARITGSSAASLNGKRPTNVPSHTLKLHGRYELRAVPGLGLRAAATHEGRRAVLPDNRIRLPAWTRLDAGVDYRTRLGTQAALISLGVTNLLDERAWREAPYQYGHAYLYPLAPRSWSLALQLDW